MYHCVICSKEIGNNEWDGICCDAGCSRRFCSDDCSQLDHYENTFPNCCPGVYWCILCKTEYLDSAKGHLFSMANHEPSPDLKTYLGENPNDYHFVDKCMNCDMWCYQFISKTDAKSEYEGVACSAWLDDEPRLIEAK